MTQVRRGLFWLLCLAGIGAWGLLVHGFASRLLSPAAGGLVAVGLSLSALVFLLGEEVQASRLRRLLDKICPSCRATVEVDHRHRRWDPVSGAWQAPATSWQCNACSYTHHESWACPTCPKAE